MSDPSLASPSALLACLRGKPPHDVDWTALLCEANARFLTPTLHQRLCDIEAVPDEVRAYLAMIHARNVRRNERLRAQLFECAKALNCEGVSPLVIKGGAHLLSTDAPMFSGRLLTDLDLVIEERDAGRALAALQRIGYAPTRRYEGEHAVASLLRPTDVGEIDLHFRPPGPSGLFDADDLRSRARRVSDLSGALDVPCATDLCAITIVHDMLHDRGLLRGSFDLRRLLDLAVWTAAEDGCDWRELLWRFATKPTARWSVEVAARTLAECFDIEIDAPLSRTSRLLHMRQKLLLASSRLAAADRAIRPFAHGAWLVATRRLRA